MGLLLIDDCNNCFESRTMVELARAATQLQHWVRAKWTKHLFDDVGASSCWFVQADAVVASAPGRTHRLDGSVVRILETLLVCK